MYVAQGRGHPALLCTTALLRTPHWLSAGHAAQLAAQGWLRCQYKARYGQQPRPCTIHALDRQAAAALAEAASAAEAAAAGGEAGGSGSASSGGTAAATSAATAAEAAAVEAAAVEAAGEAAGEAAAAAEAERLGFRPSAYCRLQPQDSRMLGSYLVVRFDEPGVAITPQQACVLYDGELCLGAALIALPGTSLHEEAGGDGSAGQRLDTAGASA